MYTRLLTVLALTLCSVAPAWAETPGSLDVDYDPNLTGSNNPVFASALLLDGKMMIGGNFFTVGGVSHKGIARLNADGTLDANFTATTGIPYAIAAQPDGRLVVCGNITQLNDVPLGTSGLLGLNADGTRDITFNVGGSGTDIEPARVAVQPDGKLVIGGYFTAVNGSSAGHIARLNANGALDTTFNVGGSGTNFDVRSVVVQPDEKIIVGGHFSTMNGTAVGRIMRLNSNGTLDTNFNSGGSGANGFVSCVARQPDGKLLIGGNFTSYNDQDGVYRIARLNADGTLDATFTSGGALNDSQQNAAIFSIALQSDGKIIIGGNFTSMGGVATGRIARLHTDGTLDTSFNPGGAGVQVVSIEGGNPVSVYSVALQADGKPVITGEFLSVNGVTRRSMARLHNDLATQNLGAPDASQVVWERGGTSPDVSQVTFDLSTDGGNNWTSLGVGTRMGTTSNWSLSGLTLPGSGQLRARGRTTAGDGNGSSSLIEKISDFPAAPGTVTEAATALSLTGATLNGIASSNGLASDASFAYSLDPTLSSGVTTTTTQPLASNAVGSVVSHALTGLTVHTSYYYRISAVNSLGTTPGAVRSFQTLNTAPTAPDDTTTATTGDAKTITLPFAAADADGDTVTVTATAPDAHLTVNDITGQSLTFTPVTGYVGPATLGYTVSDGFGGVASGTITVTITDNDAPTINTSIAPLSVYVGTLADYTSQVSDNIGVTSVMQSPTPGSATAVGDLVVTLTVADAAGNQSSPTFTVAVRPLDPDPTPILSAGGTPPGAGTADGPPADAEVKTLGVPAIDAAGHVAYLVQWGSDTDGKGKGLFTDRCLAKVGDDVDVVGVTGATFKSFTDPVIAAGRVGSLATLAGVPRTDTGAVLSFATDGTLTIIARTGSIAPGIDGTQPANGAKFASFRALALSDTATGFLAQLTGGLGLEKATGANDMGLWIKDGTDPLKLAVREGQRVGLKTIKTLVSFASGNGSPGQGRGWLAQPSDAAVLALVTFTDKSQAILSVPAGGPATILTETGVTDVNGGPSLPAATFASYGIPATNDRGTSTFLASMTIGPGGVTKVGARGVFVSDGTGAFTPLAREGYPDGVTGAVFSALKDPVLSSDDGVAFFATLKGGTAKGLAASTLWWQPTGGALALLAQCGVTPIADLPGAQWKAFTSMAIAGGRGPIFSATLVPGKGGVTAATASGVWGCDFTGEPRLLFRTGDVISGKTLKSFTLLNATVGSLGVTRSFNDAQEVVWLATFTDKSQAIITTVVP